MKFKLGDKVRIIANDDGTEKYIGFVGKIIETNRIERRISMTWDYSCEFDNGDIYPFGSHEMEKVPTKGEQLLFLFME